ncbi:MAG: hypothetical protein HWN67_22675, partial [Candidatus Helarchaeota archaeon]|nr:hypothetical protein [Candidatus Helarchaeota archaeon]
AVVLDMKKFYKTHDFLPATSYHDRTAHTLEHEFQDCLKESKKSNKIMVVESSGTNLRVNQLVAEHDHITILVVTPLEIVEERIKKEKEPDFDAETLNNAVLEGLAAGRLQYDTKYFTQLGRFYPDIKIKELKLI